MAAPAARAGNLSAFLFGSLTTVTPGDLWLVSGLAVVVLTAALGLAPQLFAVCADEDFAKVQGLPVRAYSLLIVVLAAVTVTTAMRTVGLLLVSALMVVPVATAQNVFRGFFTGLAARWASACGLAGQLVTSFYADLPRGP
jgi:zinc transport system permease protein